MAEMGIHPVLCALILVNLVSFFMMGIDKRRAVRDRWRIPERTLLIACGLFAAAGGLIGTHAFRHKTRKLKFALGVPVMLILQIALGAALAFLLK